MSTPEPGLHRRRLSTLMPPMAVALLATLVIAR
jgi:hypothetical protein